MADQPVTVHDGSIFWRGVYRTPEEVDRLARQFEAVTDWFRPTAQDYARQLRAAQRELQQMDTAA